MALLTVCAVTLALAGPLVVSGLGGDRTYCCRSGRCCCDSGRESSDGLDLKAACGCARPGNAVAFALPLGLLVPDMAPAELPRAEPVAVPLAARPQQGRAAPPEHPPRLSAHT